MSLRTPNDHGGSGSRRVPRRAAKSKRQFGMSSRRIRLLAYVAAILAAGAVIVLWEVDSLDNRPGQFVRILGQRHITQGIAHVPYNSSPPTSGPHWNVPGEAPVAWGIYQIPIPAEAQIHNLEHGGVLLQYGCRDCPELAQQIEDVFNEWAATHQAPLAGVLATNRIPHIVVAPYYQIFPGRIALTAWGRIDTLESFDHDRIIRFIEAFIDHGPERVP